MSHKEIAADLTCEPEDFEVQSGIYKKFLERSPRRLPRSRSVNLSLWPTSTRVCKIVKEETFGHADVVIKFEDEEGESFNSTSRFIHFAYS